MMEMGDVSSIHPQQDVALLRGVQCELMEDTLYFSSAAAQYNYFWGKRDPSLTWSQTTPVSVMNGVLNVKANADKVMECNYLMIRNQNFSSRWYYCIITKVDYLSPNSCQVRFTVDAVQKYFFDYEIENEFIISEHGADDTIGAHTIPEGLETGEYMIQDIKQPDPAWTSEFDVCVVSTYNTNLQPTEGAIMDNMYSGVGYQFFDDDSVANINEMLAKLTEDNKADGIVCILWLPMIFRPPREGYEDTHNITWSVSRPTSLDGYIPQNNKLFTYPYINAVLSSNNGQNNTLRFEFSNSSSISLRSSACMSSNPSILTVL